MVGRVIMTVGQALVLNLFEAINLTQLFFIIVGSRKNCVKANQLFGMAASNQIAFYTIILTLHVFLLDSVFSNLLKRYFVPEGSFSSSGISTPDLLDISRVECAALFVRHNQESPYQVNSFSTEGGTCNFGVSSPGPYDVGGGIAVWGQRKYKIC